MEKKLYMFIALALFVTTLLHLILVDLKYIVKRSIGTVVPIITLTQTSTSGSP
jgi:hypothetical protein